MADPARSRSLVLSAERRRCPACNRRNGMSLTVPTSPCRWCGVTTPGWGPPPLEGTAAKPSTVGALLEALPIVEYQLVDEWCQQSAGRIRRWRDAGPGHPLHGWGPWRDMGVVARDDDHLPGRLVDKAEAESDPNGRGPVAP